MGTRSLVRVFDEHDAELTCIYRQFDGYPDGMGQDLADLCGKMRLVNGMTDHDPDQANGMGCLAATIIARLKVRWEKRPDFGFADPFNDRVPCTEPGNVYVYPPGTKDCWEDYEYHVRPGETVFVPGERGRVQKQKKILLSCYRVHGDEKGNRDLEPLAEKVPASEFMDACMKVTP